MREACAVEPVLRVGKVIMVSGRPGSDPVLVTGASGFIGSATVRALIHAGYRVRVLVEPERSEDNLAGLAVERQENRPAV